MDTENKGNGEQGKQQQRKKVNAFDGVIPLCSKDCGFWAKDSTKDANGQTGGKAVTVVVCRKIQFDSQGGRVPNVEAIPVLPRTVCEPAISDLVHEAEIMRGELGLRDEMITALKLDLEAVRTLREEDALKMQSIEREVVTSKGAAKRAMSDLVHAKADIDKLKEDVEAERKNARESWEKMKAMRNDHDAKVLAKKLGEAQENIKSQAKLIQDLRSMLAAQASAVKTDNVREVIGGKEIMSDAAQKVFNEVSKAINECTDLVFDPRVNEKMSVDKASE